MASARATAPLAASDVRVIVTRPADQAGPWVEQLSRHGIDALAIPLIGIAAVPDLAAVDAAWADLARFDLVVFVSPNAATRFFARRPAGPLWPAALQAASPGPGTSEVLRALGVPPDRVIEPADDAPQFDSESLWAQLRLRPWQAAEVLIVRGAEGRGWLAEQLEAAGARVQFLAAYQRGPADLGAAARDTLQSALAQPNRHVWFFSSSEAVDHLLEAGLLPTDAMQSALRQATALATHPRIAERARTAGFATVLACRPSVEAVVACIQSWRPLNPPSVQRNAL